MGHYIQQWKYFTWYSHFSRDQPPYHKSETRPAPMLNKLITPSYVIIIIIIIIILWYIPWKNNSMFDYKKWVNINNNNYHHNNNNTFVFTDFFSKLLVWHLVKFVGGHQGWPVRCPHSSSYVRRCLIFSYTSHICSNQVMEGLLWTWYCTPMILFTRWAPVA